MGDITVSLDISGLQARLSSIALSQVPFATAMALNDVAEASIPAVQMEMERVFDKPTPFTKRGVAIRRASKANPVAEVYLRPIQARYLAKQIQGGVRRNLRKPGGKLPAPAGARRNQYGNLTRNAIKRLLARPNVFRGTINGVDGIWQRMRRRGRLKLLVVMSDQQIYTPRFDFEGPIRLVVDREFNRAFGQRLSSAVAQTRNRAVGRTVIGV